MIIVSPVFNNSVSRVSFLPVKTAFSSSKIDIQGLKISISVMQEMVVLETEAEQKHIKAGGQQSVLRHNKTKHLPAIN